MKVGTVFKFGTAIALAVHPSAKRDYGTVLAHWNESIYHPFVIWTYQILENGTVDVYSGSYYSTIEDAVAAWTSKP